MQKSRWFPCTSADNTVTYRLIWEAGKDNKWSKTKVATFRKNNGKIIVKDNYFMYRGPNGKFVMRSDRYNRFADCNRIAKRVASRLGMAVVYE